MGWGCEASQARSDWHLLGHGCPRAVRRRPEGAFMRLSGARQEGPWLHPPTAVRAEPTALIEKNLVVLHPHMGWATLRYNVIMASQLTEDKSTFYIRAFKFLQGLGLPV